MDSQENPTLFYIFGGLFREFNDDNIISIKLTL